MFDLKFKYNPSGDQPQAIDSLTKGMQNNEKYQVLLGATGTGKTFTIANVINNVQKPTLVLAHNKTLAGQLYSELKEFFPNNKVEYFVSYYDYYQPEAYVPSKDTYIEKDSSINDEIDELRHSATSSLITSKDVIVVSSVSCIYGIGEVEEYKKNVLTLSVNMKIKRDEIIEKLISMVYERNDFDFKRGTFRVKGDVIDIIFNSERQKAIRIGMFDDEIEKISEIESISGKKISSKNTVSIFPASHFVTGEEKLKEAVKTIKTELEIRLKELKEENKLVEYQRLEQRTKYDLEMINETGFTSGIENYSRHLSGKKAGETPTTLIDFFPKDFLLVVDESHATIPQVRAMYNGDQARKKVLVDYGFRLPSALDNRPLKFDEFQKKLNQVIFVSATPGDYELEIADNKVDQIIRPTGLLDPTIEIRKTTGQIDDLIKEIHKTKEKNERVLITTLTKRMSEELTNYLKDLGIKVAYLHSEVKTLDRLQIINDLRRGIYDCVVGINLLREGLDLPEVSLIAILDADKEGFLRSYRSLVQTMGRCARNEHGHVILYADKITNSMGKAIEETARRRSIQEEYNIKNGITPQTIQKEVKEIVSNTIKEKIKTATKYDKINTIEELEKNMREAAKDLDFEKAMELRDIIFDLKMKK